MSKACSNLCAFKTIRGLYLSLSRFTSDIPNSKSIKFSVQVQSILRTEYIHEAIYHVHKPGMMTQYGKEFIKWVSG